MAARDVRWMARLLADLCDKGGFGSWRDGLEERLILSIAAGLENLAG